MHANHISYKNSPLDLSLNLLIFFLSHSQSRQIML